MVRVYGSLYPDKPRSRTILWNVVPNFGLFRNKLSYLSRFMSGFNGFWFRLNNVAQPLDRDELEIIVSWSTA